MRIAHPPATGIDGISLRQIEPDDGPAWFDYLCLPQVFEPTSWNLRSAHDLQPVLDGCLEDGPLSPIRLAVIDESTGALVGTIGLHTRSDVNRSAEIAYDFAPSHWGRGLATRLCATVAAWSFAALGVHRLQATVLVGNERSRRVLARCGFRHEGRLRGFRMVRGEPGDFDIYSRLATDDAGVPPR
jgi:RimJ/RimL family protein N-acetyltransferase